MTRFSHYPITVFSSVVRNIKFYDGEELTHRVGALGIIRFANRYEVFFFQKFNGVFVIQDFFDVGAAQCVMLTV